MKEQESYEYPTTHQSEHIDTYHEVDVPDPYHWLEDDMSDETAAWVSAQNEITDGFLEKIEFKDDLQKRIEELYDYERVSAPFKEGSYEYFYKNTGLQDHSVVYRTPVGSKKEPVVFLDPNTFSDDGTIALRGMYFTEDASMVAYMITEGGSDWRKVIVMETETKKIVEDTLIDVKFSGLAWQGNTGFYYSSYDKPKGSQLSEKTQFHKLKFHKLNNGQNTDELIYGGKKQPNRYVSAGVTEDENYLMVYASQNTSGSQLYIKDLRIANAPFIQLQDDYFKRASVVHNEGSVFYLLTNIDAPNYKLVSVNLSNPNQSSWKEIIPETKNVLNVGSGGGKLFADYLVDAKTEVKQYDMQGNQEREIELPGIGTAFGFGGKKDDADFYYGFTSFTYPTTIFKYDIAKGTSTLHKQSDVDFDPSEYEVNQIFYKSKDGTRVPMFIVHKKGLKLNGKNPTYLYAYGGFNISLTPSFSASRISWLENGGIYAMPNLRGGGEYGEEWHLAGTKMKKQNVFDDFIAAAEYLINNKYTDSDHLAIAGGSNGGLLVGATMTQRPDLAKVALPAVGVMDMLRYHTFTAGAGWAADYGTAQDSPEMFQYLKKYSPYHALKDGTAYPATMVTTADHDDRVVPAHSFKFAARLQAAHNGPNPVMIRIETNAGHGSVSTKQQIELAADMYSFVWENMGLKPALGRKVLN